MKKMLQITLGIVTSVGGFLEIGSVTTAAQAGASFGYKLLWAILLGTICLIFLVEMSGRLAAVSKHTIVEAMRGRFGFPFFFIVLIGMVLVASLVLVAELGGIGLSIQILSGIGFPWWAIPVSFIVWLLMWKGTFSLIENGASLLGLVTLSFVVAAVKLHPDWGNAAHGLLPSFPGGQKANYWFVAVSILGASISPYLMYFYSSGAIEDEWDETYIPINRVIATFGMSLGGFLSMAVLIVAALVFHPRGIDIEKFEQASLLMTTALSLLRCCSRASVRRSKSLWQSPTSSPRDLAGTGARMSRPRVTPASASSTRSSSCLPRSLSCSEWTRSR